MLPLLALLKGTASLGKLKALMTLPKAQLKKALLSGDFTSLFKGVDLKGVSKAVEAQILRNPNALLKQIGKLSNVQKEAFSQVLNQGVKDRAEESGLPVEVYTTLSSSWIAGAIWNPTDMSLQLSTKTGSTVYTYYGVSENAWRAMVGAKGRNGSGAGTAFWTFYLRGARNTKTFLQVREAFRLSGLGAQRRE